MKSKMRVYHIPQVGTNTIFYIPVKSEIEASKVMNILACYDLFQYENNIKPDFSNMSGVQIYNEEELEWEDWYLENEEGKYFDDIEKYLEGNDEADDFGDELFKQLK